MNKPLTFTSLADLVLDFARGWIGCIDPLNPYGLWGDEWVVIEGLAPDFFLSPPPPSGGGWELWTGRGQVVEFRSGLYYSTPGPRRPGASKWPFSKEN